MDDDLRPLPRHELLFDVERALTKARALWPSKRVHGDHNALKPVANAIVEHLELCRIGCFRKPPSPRHSTPGDPSPPVPDKDRADRRQRRNDGVRTR